MVKEHPVFQPPLDVNVPIWRYVDFTKFVDLLERKTLFFSRSDLLGDPFEGSKPKVNVDERTRRFEGMRRICGISENDAARGLLRKVAVNCWHMNRHESAAMWKLYLKSDEGIAIRSTVGRLKAALEPSNDEIYVGVVRYIDFETEWLPEGNALYPFVHKRKGFAHEQELRAVIVRHPKVEGMILPPDFFTCDTVGEGIRVEVDLNTLIEAVRIAPGSPSWLTDLVSAICRRYDLHAEIRESALSQEPVY